MDTSYRSVVCVALLSVLAGCAAGPGSGGTGSPTQTSTPTPTPLPPSTTTPTTTPDTTPSPTGSTVHCADWVSFYGLGSPGETAWEPDRIAIGYTVPGDASVFFVAFEDGTVLGTTHVTTTNGVTADGDGIPLERPLNGSHVIRVGAYADTNGNGQFDRGTDAPCRSDGAVVEAGPRRINFSALQYTPAAAPS